MIVIPVENLSWIVKNGIKRKRIEKNVLGSYIKVQTSKNPLLTKSDTLLHSNPNSVEIIPSTSTTVPLPSRNNSEDDESTTLSSLTQLPPQPLTLCSQEYVSFSMSTSIAGVIENLHPQNDRAKIVVKGSIRVRVNFFP